MPYKDPEKHRQFQRERTNKNRALFLYDKKCVVCKSVERLEIDHIDPSKKTSHRIWSWTKVRRDIELEKCQVLCHKCHLKKTTEYRVSKMKHGTLGMYKSGRCKCELCRKANARYQQGRRKSRLDE